MTNRADSIVVVTGLPRSGTSMMMQMLVAAGIPALTDERRAADEDNPRGYFEFEPATRTNTDSSWVNQAHGKVVKLVHLLVPSLPVDRDYRVILMQRDLDEVVTSQQKMLQRLGRKGAAIDPTVLKKTFAAQLDATRAWLDAHAPGRWIAVSYTDALSNPKEAANRVADLLNLDANAARRMAEAVDPSLYRNRVQ